MYSQAQLLSLPLLLASLGFSSPLPHASPSAVTAAVPTVTGVNLNIAGFGPAIEAAAVDRAGNIFAADFEGTGEAPSTAYGALFPSYSGIQNPFFVAPNNTGITPLLAGSRFFKDGRVLFAGMSPLFMSKCP